MKHLRENVLALIAIAVLVFAIAFAYGQYREGLEHNRQIILRCVEKESTEGVDYNACMKLWEPFLVPFGPKQHGSY